MLLSTPTRVLDNSRTSSSSFSLPLPCNISKAMVALRRSFNSFFSPIVFNLRLMGSSFDFIVPNHVSLWLAMHLSSTSAMVLSGFCYSLVAEDTSTSFQLTIATRTVLPNVSFPVLSNLDQYRKFVETFTFSG